MQRQPSVGNYYAAHIRYRDLPSVEEAAHLENIVTLKFKIDDYMKAIEANINKRKYGAIKAIFIFE